MVPTVWLPVNEIPLNQSGKLDRRTVGQWIESLDISVLDSVLNHGEEEEDMVGERGISTMESRLRTLCAHVLNRPEKEVTLNRSFVSMGGDSISAMQLTAVVRAEGFRLSVGDALKSKTLSELAMRVLSDQPVVSSIAEDPIDEEFALSPIQELYFELSHQRPTHFHQSFFLRLSQSVASDDMARVVAKIVQRHSMLRARFTKHSSDAWVQKISAPGRSFSVYSSIPRDQVWEKMDSLQKKMDIVNGPIFWVDMYNLSSGEQLLYAVAHHLVIDLVSWRVILGELEQMICDPEPIFIDDPLPFQAWNKMQAQYAESHLDSSCLPSYMVPGDLDYWDMSETANTFQDAKLESFTLDTETSALLLTDCHNALRTEPAEIFMACLLTSFGSVFADRPLPTLFFEAHGRESWDQDIDLAGTVGWFTTMAPLQADLSRNNTLLNAVRYVKDQRRALPGNGWPYFAYSYLNQHGRQKSIDHTKVEVMFNYLGQYQQLEREDSLFRQEEKLPKEMAVSDVGVDTARMALIDVSAVLVHAVFRFNFIFNQKMRHAERLTRWVRQFEEDLRTVARSFSGLSPRMTLSDYPLLRISYSALGDLQDERLTEVGITDLGEVEDIYPCSPMQQGLLLSQGRESSLYQVQFRFEVTAPSGGKIAADRLEAAWRSVVRRHSLLRAVFINAVSSEGIFDQVILKNPSSQVYRVVASDDDDALGVLSRQRQTDANQLAHSLTLCETVSGRLFCKFELSHAIIDAVSLGILLRDLTAAYEGYLDPLSGPLYSDYIRYLQDRPLTDGIAYWKDYLDGVEPCLFPTLRNNIPAEEKTLKTTSLSLNVDPELLRIFCATHEVTAAVVFLVAWGIVLRTYVGTEESSFGYVSMGRDIPVERIRGAVGPFINMLACRVRTDGTQRVSDTLGNAQRAFVDSIEHQHVSLAQVLHALGRSSEGPLFNTMLSVQRTSENEETPTALSFKNLGAHDPTEVSWSTPWDIYNPS
jgi:non-ribosomal peptide synthase protein (TIGR01720 family)